MMCFLNRTFGLPERCMKSFQFFTTAMLYFIFFFQFLLNMLFIFWHFLMLKLVSNIFKVAEGNPTESPISKQSSGRHQLILINPQKFFRVFKKNFDIPPCANMLQAPSCISIKVTGRKVTSILNGIVELMTNNDQFAAIQRLHVCIHNMHPYLTLWISRPTTELIGTCL